MRSQPVSPIPRSLRSVVAGAVVGALLLGACGGGDDDAAGEAAPATTASTPETTPETEPDSTEPDSTEPDSTEVVTTTVAATPTTSTSTSLAPALDETEATTPPTSEPAAAADCLVGEWVVSEAEMNAFYDAVEARIDQPIDFTITGQAGLTFTDTTYAWAPAFTLQLDFSGITGTGEAGGTISGTYTTADGVLSTTVGESALTLSIDVAGQTIDGAELGNGFITSVPFVESPYSCDGPTPVIEFETIDDRHPVTLTPAG